MAFYIVGDRLCLSRLNLSSLVVLPTARAHEEFGAGPAEHLTHLGHAGPASAPATGAAAGKAVISPLRLEPPHWLRWEPPEPPHCHRPPAPPR